MFDREIKLIGEDKFEKIKNAKVAVIGLGGVGGYVVETLVRSGILNIIIVDYDKVDITNINRQLIATCDNIGEDKVLEWNNRINLINPNCKVTCLNKRLDINNIDELFELEFDYLVDAIDDINMKQEIIKRCFSNDIDIISCMGTGNKVDPSKLEVVDIRKTSYDPIAKRIRKYMSVNKINKKLPVVYSVEQNERFDGSVPSMVFVPAVAGILCSNYIIKQIINK